MSVRSQDAHATASPWSVWTLGVGAVLAALGYLLRYRAWAAPVAAFVSDAHPDADSSASTRAAGTAALLLAGL
ncbi:hypothetical protein BRC81_10000 [Halobacteriales archaeon QS_1_68_20]|nr:MAG: hypothetical protein BRC81_10000 [Halobacteriales archaeon QS_1_68_20]